MNKLAIIVPFYKIDFFEETIHSLHHQTDKRFTLYIGNDASPCDPLPILTKYFDDDVYNYYAYSENIGGQDLAAQWERILKEVNEEWFQILGDDDFISKDFVQRFYDELPSFEGQVNLVKVNNVIMNESGKIIFEAFKNKSKGFYNILDQLLLKYRGRSNSSLSEHVFYKAAYDKCGFVKYPMAWHTDEMLMLQITNLTDYYFIDKSCVYIRVFSNSISGSNKYFDQKSKASSLFFNDILKLISEYRIAIYKQVQVFRIIRRHHELLGIDNANAMVQNHSWYGRMYIFTVKTKSFLKRRSPN